MSCTPEFVSWALEMACPLRDTGWYADWRDPERTERQLRSLLTAYSKAAAEGRILDGIGLAADAIAGDVSSPDQPRGFFVTEIMDGYGGESFVREQCSRCRANVATGTRNGALAGCYGQLVWEERTLADDVEQVITDLKLGSQVDEVFLTTRPRWYGLWAHSPLTLLQASILQSMLQTLAARIVSPSLASFHRGLAVAVEHQIPLHVRYVPRGETNGRTWTVASHCPRCKAAPSASQRHCSVCGRTGHPQPCRKRNARGQRPYQPLATLLGPQYANEFVRRMQGCR